MSAAAQGSGEPLRLAISDQTTTSTVRAVLGLNEGQELSLYNEERFPSVVYPVKIESFDGLIMEGEYAHSARSPEAPILILMPSVRGSRRNYEGFERFLLEQGFSFVAVDLRGYGGSRFYKDQTVVDTAAMENDIQGVEFQKVSQDVGAIIDWVKNHNLVKKGGIFLIGDRVGGTLAAMTLAERGADLKGMAAFNPTGAYRGIVLTECLGRIQGRPILLIALASDPAATEALRHGQKANPKTRTEILHGIDARTMLYDSEQAQEVLLEFISKVK